MKEQNNIEEVFKKAFDGFEADPGANVWANVQSAVQSGTTAATVASKAAMSVVTKTIIGVAIISTAVVAGYFVLNDSDNEPSENNEVVVEENTTNNAVLVEKEDISSNENLVDNKEVVSENETIISSSEERILNTNTDVIAEVETKSESISQIIDTIKNDINDGKGFTEQTIVEAPITENDNSIPEVNSEDNRTASESSTVSDNHSENEKSKEVTPSSLTVNEPAQRSVTDEAPELDLPNVFSPNSDGINDVFTIKSEEVDFMEIQIFSPQLNKMVYEGRGKTIEWDGVLPNGNLAPEGQYYGRLTIHVKGKQFGKPVSLRLEH